MGGVANDDVDQRVETWLGTLRTDNTRAAYRRDLVVFREWLRSVRVQPRKVTVVHVERFAVHCAGDGESDATVRRRMAAVTSFYRHVGASWSMANPASRAERPVAATDERIAVLTEAETTALWKAAEAMGPKTAVVIGLVLLDGLKSHELLRLNATDLRRAGTGFAIVVPGRTVAAALVLDTRTSTAVRQYLGERRSGPLLYGDNPTRAPARLTRFGVDYIVKRTVERSGVASSVSVNVMRNTHTAQARRQVE